MTIPVIFVHGIKGSVLRNEYPVDYQDAYVWAASPLRRSFKRAHLHPLDDMVDQDPDVWIGAHEAVPMAYESFVDTMRAEYSPYTYVFTYDWRKDNRIAAQRLERFVEAVLQKVNAHQKQAGGANISKVHLIGHSMGGLVIKWYVGEILGDRAGDKVETVVTMATPYQGSLKALEMLTAGARSFFGLDVNKAERHAARTMPGVYQLLPAWDGALYSSKGNNLDVFHTPNWQKTVKDALKAPPFHSGFLGKKLREAKSFSHAMRKPFPRALRNRVHLVAGVYTDTYERVEVLTGNDENLVNFRDADMTCTTGDGTVPFLSAVPASFNIPFDNIMVEPARPVRDHVLGHHAGITRHGMVQDWILGKLEANKFSEFRFTSTG